MGEQYRDIVLWCLKVVDIADQLNRDLSDFYWDVVLELVRCAATAKAFGSVLNAGQ
jgi:hypothetical protein